MAIGTPVTRGTAKRFITNGNLTSNTWTPAANELILCYVHVPASSAIPSSITGHDGGSAWIQIGSTVVVNGSSYSLWGAFSGSSPSSGQVTVARSTTSLMTCLFDSVTGVDTSGSVANAFLQTASGSGYVTTQSLTLTGATSVTMGFWGANDTVSITPENTQLNNVAGEYSSCRLVSDYNMSGDASPSATNGYQQHSGYFALELKAAAGAAANPKGIFGMPLNRPFRGPL